MREGVRDSRAGDGSYSPNPHRRTSVSGVAHSLPALFQRLPLAVGRRKQTLVLKSAPAYFADIISLTTLFLSPICSMHNTNTHRERETHTHTEIHAHTHTETHAHRHTHTPILN